MCIPVHQRSRKERLLMALANLVLCIGIALPYAVHTSSGFGKNCLDATRGMLIGVSIGVNLFLIRFARRYDSGAISKR
jgi:hypothetical protein